MDIHQEQFQHGNWFVMTSPGSMDLKAKHSLMDGYLIKSITLKPIKIILQASLNKTTNLNGKTSNTQSKRKDKKNIYYYCNANNNFNSFTSTITSFLYVWSMTDTGRHWSHKTFYLNKPGIIDKLSGLAKWLNGPLLVHIQKWWIEFGINNQTCLLWRFSQEWESDMYIES